VDDQQRTIRLIMALRRQGIVDARVLSALEHVPREIFLDPAQRDEAYEDKALPIACGQTISQPFIVAFMTQLLEVGDRMKVLEIGTGSGYQAAILAKLCRRVYTIERHLPLLKEAERRFAALDISNITTSYGDGTKGWPQQAPFDRIIVTAAARKVPDTLLAQLKTGGILVMPVGEADGQMLLRLRMTEAGPVEERLLPVRFVPLMEGVAKES
jgi:protein-L-isoaspartate(D-aspartate) O-methyltransferase